MKGRATMEESLRRAWRGERPVLSALLIPISWLWRAAVGAHRGLYALGLRRPVQLAAPVISVGGLTVGGSGKTPVTLEIASRLLAAGRRVAVVSRGYGRASRGVVIVSDGQTLRATAAEGGDEPVWLARRAPRLIVVVGERRAEAGSTAIELGADILLLDDGLSHLALRREADVVVIDDVFRLGNGRSLPAGPLRLRPRAAGRADLVWWTRLQPDERRHAEPEVLRSRPALHSEYVPARLVDLELRPREAVTALRGQRVLAVCGIARPEGFETTLGALAANVRGLLAYPDHHPWTAEDVARIERVARSDRCEMIVTTEKDAVRLSPLASGESYRALAMETIVRDPAALDALIRRFSPATPRADAPGVTA